MISSINNKQMLEHLIEILLSKDPYFSLYWTELGPIAQKYFWRLNDQISSISPLHASNRETAIKSSQRFLSAVPEREFQWSMCFSDKAKWLNFAFNDKAKIEWLEETSSILEPFTQSQLQNRVCYRIYSNIKPTPSIRREIRDVDGNDDPERIIDVWDVIRWRIVVPDYQTLRYICLRFWETYFEHIGYCRNFYFRPRVGSSNPPYRGIHFILCPHRDRLFEVQIQTEARDMMCFLDHSILFKKLFNIGPDLTKWLFEQSWKVNIYETQSIRHYSWFKNPIIDKYAPFTNCGDT